MSNLFELILQNQKQNIRRQLPRFGQNNITHHVRCRVCFDWCSSKLHWSGTIIVKKEVPEVHHLHHHNTSSSSSITDAMVAPPFFELPMTHSWWCSLTFLLSSRSKKLSFPFFLFLAMCLTSYDYISILLWIHMASIASAN